jgi:hypothetical protein
MHLDPKRISYPTGLASNWLRSNWLRSNWLRSNWLRSSGR